ncbi:MAG: hypothetical protein SCH70_11510 [Candidatus Methanoperedens sp.]|nr:hypothetical protein [Candidatus Methanoperedens sp.]
MNKSKGMQLGAMLAAMLLLSMAFMPSAMAVESTEQVKINGIDDIIKPKIVSYNDVKKGDIIATGKRNNSKELCQVSFGMSIDFGEYENGSRSVLTKVDDNCNVIVAEKNESIKSIKLSSGTVTTQSSGQRFIKMDYWMYGKGGEWDKLTEDYSEMTFGYD